MVDLHIYDFYKDVGKILNQLYLYFPRKSSVFVEDIIGPEEPDEFGLFSKRYEACFATMLWLASEQYLTFDDTIRQTGIDQAVLTHKGFVALSRRSKLPESLLSTPPSKIPESMLLASTSNMQFIRDAIRSGNSTQISRVILSVLELD